MNQSASNLSILGIDVSKGKFDVALLREGKCKHKRFLNNLEGFKKLREWLAEYKVERLHACMESTSTYGEALAEYLHDRGFMVSIANPARIKGFAQSELIRSKSDKDQSSIIAKLGLFYKKQNEALPSNEIRELRSL